MNVAWGLVVVFLSLLAWGGQVLSWLTPDRAARWGLAEAESEVDPAFWADGRAEARWDALTLWPMVVAGALLVFDHDRWPVFGLVGAGTYVYFAGRGVLARRELRRRGLAIGPPASVRTAMAALTMWGVMAAITMGAAVIAVET